MYNYFHKLSYKYEFNLNIKKTTRVVPDWIEQSLREPKSLVLPLHHRTILKGMLFSRTICLSIINEKLINFAFVSPKKWMLQVQNSNLRPLGHEPSELPLLQPAICAAYLHRQTASQSLSIQIILNKQINNYYEYLCKNI